MQPAQLLLLLLPIALSHPTQQRRAAGVCVNGNQFLDLWLASVEQMPNAGRVKILQVPCLHVAAVIGVAVGDEVGRR
jgi:hypothetical protein